MPAKSSNSPVATWLADVDGAPAPYSTFYGGTDEYENETVGRIVSSDEATVYLGGDGRQYRLDSIPAVDKPNTLHSRSPQSHAFVGQTNVERLPKEYVALNDASNRRRPVSNTAGAAIAASPRPLLNGNATNQVTEAPKAVTYDVAQTMRPSSITRFSDTPFYLHSDGGVQAAETLTDPHPVPGLPISQSPPGQSSIPLNAQVPTPQGSHTTSFAARGGYMCQGSGTDSEGMASISGFQFAQVKGGRYPQKYPASNHNFSRLHSTISRSPKDFSNPGSRSIVSPLSPHSPFSHPLTAIAQVGSSHMPTPPQHASLSSSPFQLVGDGRRLEGSFSQSFYGAGGTATGWANPFDTQTPVVVIESGLEPVSQIHSRSDATSTTRENVRPGEDVIYDGHVGLAQNLSLPFASAWLKAFRNTLTNDLRFYCRVGNESENFWMKGAHAQIVPTYAYDQRFPNVLYLRDNEGQRTGSSPISAPGTQSSGHRHGLFQFSRFQELCDFQAKLTGEKVVLDISSVKLIRISRANSRSSDTFSSVRVQIWHEDEGVRGRSGSQSDVASFVTAGTALSGPLRDRTVASSSRLMIFLGRLDEYLTLFITDDLDVAPEGQATVKIRPRKGGSMFKRAGSRWPGIKVKRELRRGSEPAGLDVHGQAAEPDSVAAFDLYENFEIEFESSPSQDNFVRKWGEVIKERRRQRDALEKIQEEMNQATFTGKTAGKLW